jgi:hypothetical protein
MKFINYINEEFTKMIDIIMEALNKDVRPDFLDVIKTTRNFLYRGSNRKTDSIIKVKTRTDRVPLTSTIEFHNYMDEFFGEKFRWRARSEGVFTTGKEYDAAGYGGSSRPYLFFPIGSFKFIWSTRISDLYSLQSTFVVLSDLKDRIDLLIKKTEGDKNNPTLVAMKRSLKTEKGYFNKNLATYIDKNLEKAIKSGNEIMFKCDEYYLVDSGYEDAILERVT